MADNHIEGEHFDIPKWISPPTTQQKAVYFGQNIINNYKRLFNRHVKRQPHVAELTLHTIIGQLPAVKQLRIYIDANEIDLRVSGCVFAPVNSGIEAGLDLMTRVAGEIGLNTRLISSIFVDELVGTCTDKKVYVPLRKGWVVESQLNCGILDPRHDPAYDIIVLSKCDSLSSKVGARILFKAVLSTSGSGGNRVAVEDGRGGTVSFMPDCSLLLMAQPRISKKLLAMDVFRHLLIINNDYGVRDRKLLALDMIGSLAVKRVDCGELADIVKPLRYVNDYWMKKSDTTITISRTAIQSLSRVTNKFFKLDGIPKETQTMLEAFIPAWMEHLWRLAWHHMILRLDNTITPEDIGYAKGIVLALWRRLCSTYGADVPVERITVDRHDRYLSDTIAVYRDMCVEGGLDIGEFIARRPLIDKLRGVDYWNVHRNTVNRWLCVFESDGVFEFERGGQRVLIRQRINEGE